MKNGLILTESEKSQILEMHKKKVIKEEDMQVNFLKQDAKETIRKIESLIVNFYDDLQREKRVGNIIDEEYDELKSMMDNQLKMMLQSML